jgi:hypothetical protein
MDANPRGFNIGAPTSVNDTPLALALALPRDGGFGQVPTAFGSFGNIDFPPGFPRLDLEEFNSPPVVESADTAPFFHNHTVATLEEAVAFYGSPAFKNGLTPLLIPINISADPNDPEVRAIAGFLRVLNALENIRSAINVAQRARTMNDAADQHDLARLSLAEIVDAEEVLSKGAFAGADDQAVRSARTRLATARVLMDAAQRLPAPPAIASVLNATIQQLREARAALANPATLPASFRN